MDLIDAATWRSLRLLQSSSVIQFSGGSGRVLHQAVTLCEDEAAAAARIQAERATTLRAKADRALRKAQVLAAGGFPEEVPELLAKSIGHVGAVKLALSGELADDIALATAAEVRELVEQELLPLQAMTILDTVAPASGTPSLSSGDIDRLLAATAEVIAACTDDVNALD